MNSISHNYSVKNIAVRHFRSSIAGQFDEAKQLKANKI